MLRRLLIAVVMTFPVIARAQDPTATPDIRRANLAWRVSGTNYQPAISWANGGVFGIYMPSNGRLENLAVKCDTAISSSFTVQVNGISTLLSCNSGGHPGCLDWYAVSGDYANYSTGDYVVLAASGIGGQNCNATITAMAQDRSAHDAIIDFGIPNITNGNNKFCLPEEYALLGPSCGSTSANDAFLVPRDATVTNYGLNDEGLCAGFCTSIGATLHNVTTATDILSVSIATGSGLYSVGGTCTSNCDVTGGNQLYLLENAVGGLHPNPATHVLEFGNTGQIITARVSQWSDAFQRYISPLNPASATVNGGTYCNDGDGIGQNLRARLNGIAPQDVYVYLCAGPDDDSIVCGPNCRIDAGQVACSDLANTLDIPQGYVYTIDVTSPGQDTGTIGVSFEMAKPAAPLAAPGACGITTPVPTWTPTAAVPTDTPTQTPTPTETPTEAPTAPGTTATPTPTAWGVCIDLPTATPTTVGTATRTPTPKYHQQVLLGATKTPSRTPITPPATPTPADTPTRTGTPTPFPTGVNTWTPTPTPIICPYGFTHDTGALGAACLFEGIYSTFCTNPKLPLDIVFYGDGTHVIFTFSTMPGVTWEGQAIDATHANLTGFKMSGGPIIPTTAQARLQGGIGGYDTLVILKATPPLELCASPAGCAEQEACQFQNYSGDIVQVIDAQHPAPTRIVMPHAEYFVPATPTKTPIQ